MYLVRETGSFFSTPSTEAVLAAPPAIRRNQLPRLNLAAA